MFGPAPRLRAYDLTISIRVEEGRLLEDCRCPHISCICRRQQGLDLNCKRKVVFRVLFINVECFELGLVGWCSSEYRMSPWPGSGLQ